MTRVWLAAGSFALGLVIGGSALIVRAEPQGTAKAAAQTATPKVEKSDGIVGVYIESVARQISLSDLQRKYPGTSAAKVDLASMKADTIVGWYDKGHNYHEQKMEKNLGHDFGGLRVIQPMLRGTAVK